MKRITTPLIACLLLCGSSVALAAPHLTPQQCNDYPFKQPTGEITHAQLKQELEELEAVGYDPSGDNINYPSELMTAEAKVQAEYRQDCLPLTQAATPQPSQND
ncbi:DUF4148 domain-containing protein [Pararobbsia alpina]|uniref:DUF4148 domain-containing protein n=1 Tax=Pararobbsia alpina TaxID=621374 RepID=A0A6S7B0D3_9BURK|nr:DUF4148 domain-containing protein [Pararobbsia alpina]CAB3783651.1 hypothetical protein LMG28138_01683 [Pararobbsia alpina]